MFLVPICTIGYGVASLLGTRTPEQIDSKSLVEIENNLLNTSPVRGASPSINEKKYPKSYLNGIKVTGVPNYIAARHSSYKELEISLEDHLRLLGAIFTFSLESPIVVIDKNLVTAQSVECASSAIRQLIEIIQ